MASKNITILLFLFMINVVFFGFTMAQAPICPKSSTQLQNCANKRTVTVGGIVIQTPGRCCSLVIGVDDLLAAICVCDALKLSDLSAAEINETLGQVLGFCGITRPAGFICA